MEFCQCPSFREKKLPIQDSKRVSKIHIRLPTFNLKYGVFSSLEVIYCIEFIQYNQWRQIPKTEKRLPRKFSGSYKRY